jgi:hypothetical protein
LREQKKMRSLDTNRLPVASGDHLVGAVEGKCRQDCRNREMQR